MVERHVLGEHNDIVMGWVRQVRAGSGTSKAVLIGLALHADPYARVTAPQGQIAEVMSLTPRTVRTSVLDLAARGIVDRRMRWTAGGSRLTDLIVLNVTEDIAARMRACGPPLTIADDFISEPPEARGPRMIRGVKAGRWMSLRRRVFARDGFACTYCGSVALPLHCDHVVPFSRGGPTAMENLTTACAPCNIAKNDRTPEEWRASL